jgi:hypothetical protein
LADPAPVKRRSGEHDDEDAHKYQGKKTRVMDIAEKHMTMMVKRGEKESWSRLDYPVQNWAG